jgi:hypothetical protein
MDDDTMPRSFVNIYTKKIAEVGCIHKAVVMVREQCTMAPGGIEHSWMMMTDFILQYRPII